jgi:hypothetical protein
MSDTFTRAPRGGFVLTTPGMPLRPDQTDALLQNLNNELERTAGLVEQARTNLAAAQKAHKKAEARLLLSPNSPRVGRTAGAVTAAERDAWVFLETADLWDAVQDAEVLLAVATDNAWKVNHQVSVAQSLNKNATEHFATYRGGGR